MGKLDSKDPIKSAQSDIELHRITERRKALDIDQRPDHPRHWGIALSGGGIRSATFALGVLQAMARAPALPIKPCRKPSQQSDYLLPHFDYLSTVSGGGYIGSFFISLFVPGRLTGNPSPSSSPSLEGHFAAAENAYAALRLEPPGRIHTTRDYSENRGEAAMAWLRENGRYLLPSGSGDFFYAMALTLRNLLSVQFVIGMPVLLILSLLAMVRLYVNALYCAPGIVDPESGVGMLLCTSLWWLPLLWLVAAGGPLVLAFWMVYSVNSQDEKVEAISWCSVIMSIVGIAFAGAALKMALPANLTAIFLLGAFEIGTMLLVFLTLIFFMYLNSTSTTFTGPFNSVRNYRVLITRLLSQQLIAVIAMGFIAIVTSLTEWVYGQLHEHPWSSIAVATPPVLIALVRLFSKFLDDKSVPGWLSKLPTDILAGIVGFAILLSITVLWGLLVAWVRDDVSLISLTNSSAYYGLVILSAAALGLTLSSGQFIGFINLSSLQAFYSSRLARAYLGASNGQRFTFDTNIQSQRSRLSVADAMAGDDLQLGDYYASVCAPIHLINVTMNLTVDPAEQLVQRDRKGKPLCIAPGDAKSSSKVSFILDGELRAQQNKCSRKSEINQPLSVSYWIATSGAALTTGLGRATSLGTSMALGLANVRLGTWWPCNFDSKSLTQSIYQKVFPIQAYLLYELTARFHGLRREFQYLSDGGHFENTAAYELIRKERDIELIVLCDSGCDVNYEFDDLANLTRLARIDQSLEIEVDTEILKHPILGSIFGDVGDFSPQKEADQRCALLLNVFKKDCQRDLQSRILVLKPRVIVGVSADVSNYAVQNPKFPNESTADQFFNEAQFESYRQLGLTIGQLLFGHAESGKSKVAQALWSYLWSEQSDITG